MAQHNSLDPHGTSSLRQELSLRHLTLRREGVESTGEIPQATNSPTQKKIQRNFQEPENPVTINELNNFHEKFPGGLTRLGWQLHLNKTFRDFINSPLTFRFVLLICPGRSSGAPLELNRERRENGTGPPL